MISIDDYIADYSSSYGCWSMFIIAEYHDLCDDLCVFMVNKWWTNVIKAACPEAIRSLRPRKLPWPWLSTVLHRSPFRLGFQKEIAVHGNFLGTWGANGAVLQILHCFFYTIAKITGCNVKNMMLTWFWRYWIGLMVANFGWTSWKPVSACAFEAELQLLVSPVLLVVSFFWATDWNCFLSILVLGAL